MAKLIFVLGRQFVIWEPFGLYNPSNHVLGPLQHILDPRATLLQSEKDGDVENNVVWLWVDTP